MNDCVIIIDNSNIFIEGQKFSAKQKGVVLSLPANKDTCDPSWRIDFGKLLFEVADGKNITKAILVGSRPPQNDSVWGVAKSHGFDVFVHERNSAGKEKAVDTEIVAQGTEIICTLKSPSILKLLSGDRDFIPLITMANKKGWETEMWAFKNAYKTYGQMANAVTRIKPLDDIFNKIGHHEFAWPD